MKMRIYYFNAGTHPVVGQVYTEKIDMLGDILEKRRYERYIRPMLKFAAFRKDTCEEILATIEEIESRSKGLVEFEGYDTDLILSREGGQINININEEWIDQEDGRFELGVIKNAITGMREFLSLPKAAESGIEICLESGALKLVSG